MREAQIPNRIFTRNLCSSGLGSGCSWMERGERRATERE